MMSPFRCYNLLVKLSVYNVSPRQWHAGFLHTQRRGGGHSIRHAASFFLFLSPWSSFPPPANTIKGVVIVAVPTHDECGAHREDRRSARHSSSPSVPWVSGPSETRVLHSTEVTGHNGGSQDPLFLKGQLSGAGALWVILAAVAHTKDNWEFF